MKVHAGQLWYTLHLYVNKSNARAHIFECVLEREKCNIYGITVYKFNFLQLSLIRGLLRPSYILGYV
jgi:hypothetical protein